MTKIFGITKGLKGKRFAISLQNTTPSEAKLKTPSDESRTANSIMRAKSSSCMNWNGGLYPRTPIGWVQLNIENKLSLALGPRTGLHLKTVTKQPGWSTENCDNIFSITTLSKL